MAFFEKTLTSTDVEKRLSIPTRCFAHFKGRIEGTHAVGLKVKDDKGQLMTFCCTTRKKGYKKPVFTKGWREYVRRKKLRAGDKIVFQPSGDEDGGVVYKIEAKRRITILGPQVWCNVSDA
ncbi:hypothetical protein HS088_TW08G00383 [Tripterygium wilfordii]|uniref:TF-B3 domain-containing protein n=1 Tax=Tripterygium wilfordii TaxID=458696 RepID=A0A7J7DBN6_TRIWF|nr:hypothetical protein HS088_TW08G00383 [Tripterygium wilfordii]